MFFPVIISVENKTALSLDTLFKQKIDTENELLSYNLLLAKIILKVVGSKISENSPAWEQVILLKAIRSASRSGWKLLTPMARILPACSVLP